MAPILLDCTLRDGGYYNDWDFAPDLIEEYLQAMAAAKVDIVELGFRFLKVGGFKGACAFTTDEFLRSLAIPKNLTLGVMVNASDLVGDVPLEEALQRLFPVPASNTPVDLVRIASHSHEFEDALPACTWLRQRGYKVGFNLMQVSERSRDEVARLGELASSQPIDVLYFADSMGSMTPDRVSEIIAWFREGWGGEIGIHTHDNMGFGLANSLRAIEGGARWIDATVTGMGRGPGNARTEEVAIEVASIRKEPGNFVPLFSLVRNRFGPMKAQYGWGTNPYYFLAGKYGIHPTFIQEMLADPRYGDEDVLAVIDTLALEGGTKFSPERLAEARHGFSAASNGSWSPRSEIEGRDVLILGSGPGVERHHAALEVFVTRNQPIVMALNTQGGVREDLIDFRLACHPVRLVADHLQHAEFPQPLIAPVDLLPQHTATFFSSKRLLDFGMSVKKGEFEVGETGCTLPSPLVSAYALAVAAAGRAAQVYMAGFDGFAHGDPRNDEMSTMLEAYASQPSRPPLIAITPSRFNLAEKQSVYGLTR